MIMIWMPVYNEAANLQKAIDTVLAQTYKDFVLVISDNHSTDGSGEIIERALRRDSRISRVAPSHHMPSSEHGRYLYSEVLNRPHGRKYSIFIGGHDEWEPNLLHRLVTRAEANPDAAIVYTDSFETDAQGRPIKQYRGWVQAAEIARPFLPQHVLLGLTHNIVWGGLWNEARRRSVAIRHRCIGADHFLIAEMALTGSLLYEPGSAVYLRQAHGAGNWQTYIDKHLPDAVKTQPLLDFVNQLEWASSLVDKAVEGSPFHSQASVRNMLKSSLLTGYICRYWECLNAFEGGVAAFFGHPLVGRIFQTQTDCTQHFDAFLSQALPPLKATPPAAMQPAPAAAELVSC